MAPIRQDSAGGWFFDFNLDGAGKVDCDEGDAGGRESDKSLKTVNAVRKIPVHCLLIELGLIQYRLYRAGIYAQIVNDLAKVDQSSKGVWLEKRLRGL